MIAPRRARHLLALWTLLVCSLLALPHRALALDPDLLISQYAHTAWRVRDGYFSAPPLAIAQTKDGQLWLGGEGGLLRFDGVQFSSWTPPAGQALPDERIYGLLAASDGTLWIGTGSGLAQWNGDKLVLYAKAGRFSSLLEDSRGTIWAGHTRARDVVPPLCHFAQNEFKCFAFSDLPGMNWVGALKEDRNGDLWIATAGAVCHRPRTGQTKCYVIPISNPQETAKGTQCMAIDSDDVIWLDGGNTGIWQLKSGRWKHYKEFAHLKLQLKSSLVDRAGGLWIGDLNHGLIRRAGGEVEQFDRTDGLSGETVTALFEDREGSVWAATSAGLDRFRDVKVATITRREGLPLPGVASISASRDGGLWIAGTDQLVHTKLYKPGTYEPVGGLPENGSFGAIFESSRGTLWLGVGHALVWRENGQFHKVRSLELHQGGERVRAISEDIEGNIWAATTDPEFALVRIRDGQVLEKFTAQQLGGQISAMAADPKGGVWLSGANPGLMLAHEGIVEVRVEQFPGLAGSMFFDSHGLWASTRKGIVSYDKGNLNILTTKNGLPCDNLDAAIKDDDGALWLKGTCGLIRIPGPELELWLKDPGRRVQISYFDALDGVQAGASSFVHATKTSDGRIWFALEEVGLQVVNPRRLQGNSTPPPVAVTKLVADHQPYNLNSKLHLPALTRDIEIDYTAYSLLIPEKVHFRYRLEGVDKSWQDVGARRQAYFADLKPGSYRFDVLASNNDGVWNQQGAALDFSIAPAFYQTRSFSLLCLAAGGCFAWAIYLWRVRTLTARLHMQFRERLAERTRIAQELHDTLLQGVISASMQLHVANDQLEGNTPAKLLLTRVIELMGHVIDQGRSALHNLRLAKDGAQDIGRAFSQLPQELGATGEADFCVAVEGSVRSLRPVICDEVYRIGREALTNAFRHAGASRIVITLEYGPHELRLLVRDNGRGIDSAVLQSGRTGHWGLIGMRERASQIGGKLKVWGQATGGTEVELRVPGRIAFEAEAPSVASVWFLRMYTKTFGSRRVKRRNPEA